MSIVLSILRPFAGMLVATFAMVASACGIAAIVGFVEGGSEFAFEGVAVALLWASIAAPVSFLCGLIWLPALLMARGASEEARVAVVALAPLSFVVLYILSKLYVQVRSSEASLFLDWGPILFFAPVTMIFSGVFLFVDRRWGNSGPVLLVVVAAVLGLGMSWAYVAFLSKFS